jgi:hypothetical protein
VDVDFAFEDVDFAFEDVDSAFEAVDFVFDEDLILDPDRPLATEVSDAKGSLYFISLRLRVAADESGPNGRYGRKVGSNSAGSSSYVDREGV